MHDRLARVGLATAFWLMATLAMLASCAATTPHGCSKNKAYVTAMKSDLRNLMSAQEAFRESHGHFATQADLRSGALEFRESPGVSVFLEHADRHGWRARTTHSALSRATCAIDSVTGHPRCSSAPDPWRPRFTGSRAANIAIDFWLMTFSLARYRRRRFGSAAAPA